MGEPAVNLQTIEALMKKEVTPLKEDQKRLKKRHRSRAVGRILLLQNEGIAACIKNRR